LKVWRREWDSNMPVNGKRLCDKQIGFNPATDRGCECFSIVTTVA